MHSLLRKYLALLARILIKQKKPFIIGVTGTAGKTTVTSFVVAFLKSEFGVNAVGYSQYHYNGEFGLPLTVIGAKTGGKNIFKWIFVFFIFVKRFFTKYPQFLVLEYGVDHPGEMDFLLSIAHPDVAIITPIFPNHMEQFGTEENYEKEKMKITIASRIFAHQSLYRLVPESALSRVEFFGKENTDFTSILAKDISLSKNGTQAKVEYASQDFLVTLPMIGKYQAENILPLFGIAKILGINPKKIEEYAKNFYVHSGRSCIFHGINNSVIIDGTYNGGFIPMIEGVQTALDIAGDSFVYILLGDMRELGEFEESKHIELAHEMKQIFSDFSRVEFFLVGPLMQKYVAPILSEDFVVHANFSSRKLGKIMKEKIQNLDSRVLVFAKGSQNTIFLEEAIKEIIGKKEHSLLCRQSSEWLDKKKKFFDSL